MLFEGCSKTNVLAVDSSRDLTVDPLHAERSEHAVAPIGPTLQVYHEHLRTFDTHTHTSFYVDVLVPNGYLMEFSCRSEIHTSYLIEAQLIRLSDGRGEVTGGLDGGISHYMSTEARQLEWASRSVKVLKTTTAPFFILKKIKNAPMCFYSLHIYRYFYKIGSLLKVTN